MSPILVFKNSETANGPDGGLNLIFTTKLDIRFAVLPCPFQGFADHEHSINI